MAHFPLHRFAVRSLLVGSAALLTASSATFLAAQSKLTEHTLRLDPGTESGSARLGDFAWMTGRWVGTGLGGQLEENWGAPSGGSMLATFRLDRDGAPRFYELCALVETEGSVAYRVKHFNPDMTGWEEREEVEVFPLVRVEAGVAYFSGLTVERDGDICRQYLAMRQRDGTHREMVLETRLAPSAPPQPPTAGSLEFLAPLAGEWVSTERPDAVVRRFAWTAGRHGLRLIEPGVFEGTAFAAANGGGASVVGLVQDGENEPRLVRGRFRLLEGGLLENVVEWSESGAGRRGREVYAVNGDQLVIQRQAWRDGAWHPTDPKTVTLRRRQGADRAPNAKPKR